MPKKSPFHSYLKAIGKRGGKANTEAQRQARARNIAAGRAKRLETKKLDKTLRAA